MSLCHFLRLAKEVWNNELVAFVHVTLFLCALQHNAIVVAAPFGSVEVAASWSHLNSSSAPAVLVEWVWWISPCRTVADGRLGRPFGQCEGGNWL